ncbi:hypothetical protein SAMN04488102_103146 [Alkalibacterium subtropicum]|uniref:Uncharacterized protein n=1 Tax=Alkalibacterium subtropicum TaxID=753702 RepID=A0A1I1GLN2_9LACT|nr:hypothetical protein [Alkalibacterium subtropicum]SFC12677.1 hypothetical protein SAMN04488102_103146 [Alkalibacterium subtropicum]
MTNTPENVSFIKWKDGETELFDLLKGHTKADLLELAESQSVAVRKSWNKTKISAILSEKITELAETIYHPVLKEVLERLPDRETNVYRVSDLSEIVGFIPLIIKGFFFVARDGDGILLLIPEDILFSVKDRMDLDSETNEILNRGTARKAPSHEGDRKAELLNSWKEKSLAIYGNVSVAHLQKIWNRYFDDPVSPEEIRQILN